MVSLGINRRKKLFTLLVFVFCLGLSRAQVKDTNDVYIPNAFYDYEQEFLVWMQEPPADFCAQLFDRWGNLLFESSDPKFGLDAFLSEQKVREAEPYWLILEFTFPGSEPLKVQKQIIYGGSRC